MASTPELVVKPLHGEAYHFPLEKDVISIGRSKRNDLVLADQWLSRHHAEIRNDEGDFTIADLESRNGTYVNGEKIARIIPLQNDDVITLGDQQLTFVDSGPVVLTPGSFNASSMSMFSIFAWARGLRRIAQWSIPGSTTLSMNSVWPVMRSPSSTRRTHFPM